tara:strand:+ start:1144 stop:1566 length:423 start_codon:yes stop_codon:yes gene_type:complete
MSLYEREKILITDFGFFHNWDEKYEYIISLGKELPSAEPGLRSSKNLITGCQSNVWLSSRLKDGRVFFSADSDAIITRGLIALLLKIFSDAEPQKIILFELSLIRVVGLDRHLSMNRSNGLSKMVEKIKKISLNYLKEQA